MSTYNTDPQFYGYIFLSIGIIIRYVIHRRRFNRRNVAGLYGFSSFEHRVIIPLIEFVFKWAANALILLGIFMAIKW
ncbi:hypothetical protein B0I18_107260 [Taibaiella chishuiensis]|uniref:Uncharacterized protein n=1 Tax=Taibaiella chishuiensis TaxID=1434707 RepID=A0A2P8D0V6_9BACT|nr:hypothetical protein B0I18_107260 [Taibaiella chishuiensis]